MNSSEFWCRAFLETLAPVFQACIGTGAKEDNVVAQCADMADAALAVAQRRGMVTAGEGETQVATGQHWRNTATGDAFRVRDVADGTATLVKLAPLHAADHLRRVMCAELQDGITWERESEQAPQGERVKVWPVDFTAERDGDLWTLRGWELGSAGIQVLAGRDTYPMGAAVVHIRWAETVPPKPVKVWLERDGGA